MTLLLKDKGPKTFFFRKTVKKVKKVLAARVLNAIDSEGTGATPLNRN